MENLATMNDADLESSLADDVVETIPEDISDGSEILPIEEEGAPTPSDEPAVAATEQVEEPAQPAPTLESLQELLAKAEARLKEKDQFIGKQGNLIGQLKQQGTPQPQKAELPTEEKWMAEPNEAAKQFLAAQQAEQEQQSQMAQQQAELMTTRNKEITSQFVPEFDNLMGDIEKVLIEEDGLTAEALAPFKGNPYATPPEVLIQLAKRVELRNKNATLTTENDSLKAEIEKLKGKSSRVLNNVENTARQNGGPRPPTSPAGNTVSPAQLSGLSYDEILAQLND